MTIGLLLIQNRTENRPIIKCLIIERTVLIVAIFASGFLSFYNHSAKNRPLIVANMEILLKSDVMDRLKISEATLYRWVSESRKGTGTFPLPASQPRRTLRWNSDDIDQWCQAARHKSDVSAKKQIKPVKYQATEQEYLQALLEKHGLNEK
jgi:predicted DNA-binding transcriptional regulator AlpA